MKRFDARHALLAGLVALPLGFAAAPARAVDWGAVPGHDITLIFPGQTSWEWILTPSDHDGAKKFRGGKACRECHEGEEKDVGEATTSGKNPKAEPVDKPPTLTLNVKAAHDAERVYLRFEWSGSGQTPAEKQDPDAEAKVTVLWGTDSVVSLERGGCWGACHDDLRGMPSAQGEGLTKYLPLSRTKLSRSGGGENYKSDDELAKLRADGSFAEYWQADLNKGAAAVPVDGWILDKRRENEQPAVSAEGGFEGGKWVVVLSRALKAPGPAYHDIVPGKTYIVGFAVHDAWAAHRFHHVSFRHTFVLDQGDADIVAAGQ